MARFALGEFPAPADLFSGFFSHVFPELKN